MHEDARKLAPVLQALCKKTIGGEMNKLPVYRWSGEYFGFIKNSKFFDSSSNYLGWVDEKGHCWNEDGSCLGEIVENNYILYKPNATKPHPKVAKIPPIPPIAPIPKINKIAKIPKLGWEDALDKFE